MSKANPEQGRYPVPIVERNEKNPILTKNDIPYPVVTVHNAGVCKNGDRYIMVFRSHRDNVFPTMDGSVYRLGVALHDLKDPSRILGVGDSWILQPEEEYEVTGYVHNVVFSCGAVPESDGTAVIEDLVNLCLNNSRPAL